MTPAPQATDFRKDQADPRARAPGPRPRFRGPRARRRIPCSREKIPCTFPARGKKFPARRRREFDRKRLKSHAILPHAATFWPVFPAKSLGAGNFPCPALHRPGPPRALGALPLNSGFLECGADPHWDSPRRRRPLDRPLRRLAHERPIDVERALDADRVEIHREPGLGVGAAEVAKLLQERP